MQTAPLRSTQWLAKRLGLSVTTIERLRASGSADVPPAILIGRSVRYDETAVEKWLLARMTPAVATPHCPQQGGRL